MTGTEDRHRANIQDLQAQVRQLLDFAVTQALLRVDDELIRRAVRCASPDAPVTVETETELWLCLNRLVDLIDPATPHTVKTTMSLLDSQTGSGSGRMVRWSSWAIFPIILLLIVVQTYSLILSNRSKHLAALESDWQELVESYRQQYEVWLTTDSGSSGEKLAGQRLDDLNTEARNHQTRVLQTLCEVSAYLPLGVANGTDPCALLRRLPQVAVDPAGAGRDRGYSILRTRPAVDPEMLILVDRLRALTALYLEVVSLYILPTLYGFIGAYVYILRQMLERLETWSLGAALGPKRLLRLALGAILGATVGLIFTGSEQQLTAAGFSLALFAFLAGYSAEFIFSIFDALIRRGKAAFAEDQPGDAGPRARQAGGGAGEARTVPPQLPPQIPPQPTREGTPG